MKKGKIKIKTGGKTEWRKRELFIPKVKGPVSSLYVIDHKMKIGSNTVRMGGISSVETVRQHRNKGYMRLLMNDTIKYMKKEQFDISVLFGIPKLYTKFGYAACLLEYKLSIPTRDAEDSIKQTKRVNIRKARKSDLKAFLKLYHKANSTRTATQIRKWNGFRIIGDNFLFLDARGKLSAYAVIEKSDNSMNIKEIGILDNKFCPAIMSKFVQLAVKKRCEHIDLQIPFDHDFALYCRQFGEVGHIKFSKDSEGMARIINLDSIFKKIKPELELRLARIKTGASLEIKTEIGSVSFLVGMKPHKKCYLKLPQSILAQLLMGYRKIREIANGPGIIVKGDLRILDVLFTPDNLAYCWKIDWY